MGSRLSLVLAMMAAVAGAAVPPALERELARMETTSDFDYARDREFRRLLGEGLAADEPAVVSRLLGMSKGFHRTRALRHAGELLAERSEASVLGLLARLPEADRDQVAEAGFRVLAERGMARARELALGMSPGSAREQALRSVAMVLARSDARGAEQLAAPLPMSDRNYVRRVAAMGWPLDDARGLLAWVSGLEGADEQDRAGFIQAWGFKLFREDPKRATRVLPMLPDEVRPMLAGHVARRLAETDLRGALAWMETLPEQADRSQALSGLLGAWVATDLETVRAVVEQWPDASFRRRLHASLAWEWSRRDAGAALMWAASLPPDVREDALVRALAQQAFVDKAAAVRALMALPAGAERDGIAERFVENQPGSRELAAWAAAYPHAATARKLVRRAVFGWALTADEERMVQLEGWVLGIADAGVRDQALVGALNGSVRLIRARGKVPDPDLYVRLLEPLGDAALRREQAATVDELWRKAYPGDARKPFARFLGEPAAGPAGK